MAKKATKKKAKAKEEKNAKGGISHHIQKSGKCGVLRRFVPRDIITIPWGRPIKDIEIIGYIKNGYEVRIGSVKSGIRIFPYLNTDFKTQRIVAQSHGDFRDAINDVPWNESGKVLHDPSEMRSVVSGRNKFVRDGYSLAMAGVTPDKLITFECEKCGHPNTVRVGKKLV